MAARPRAPAAFPYEVTVAVLVLVASLVASVVYTYGYHLLGTPFNDLFLLDAAVVASGAVALTVRLSTLDVRGVAQRVRSPRRARAAAAVLGALATALGALWVYVAIESSVAGTTPTGSALVETDTVVHLGMALDLVLLVPLYGGAAVLLWRGSAWGFVLATIAVVSGVLHQVGYLVAMPVQVASDVPGAVAVDPGEPVVVALYLVGLWLLLGGRRARPRRANDSTSSSRRGGSSSVSTTRNVLS